MTEPDAAVLAAAYEGLETGEAFPDAGAVAAYREAMLARSRPQADVLAALLDPQQDLLEVGCGNGRLLVELHRRGAVRNALGVDLARSRIEFARAWATDEGASGLRFEAADVFALDLDIGSLGALLCITGVFAYFEPLAAGAAARLLASWHRALARGGLLCLELYPHAKEVALLAATGGTARTWKELDFDDPWRFYLSTLTLDPETGILTHDKTFVHRTTGAIDEGRREELVLYTPAVLARLLEAAGFAAIELREGWSDTPYAGGEILLVLARRP